MIEGCDRAARLVDQLLTLARVEPDATRPTGSADLPVLARQVVAELVPFALDKDVEVEVRGSETLLLEGHADLLCVLLRNLVDNAIRYSPPGCAVSVDIDRAGDDARLVVSDQGPGITPDERARIGQRFYRVVGTGETGSGLGLSIVRRIVEIHGAQLRFEEGENERGLRVVVEFPGGTTPATQRRMNR